MSILVTFYWEDIADSGMLDDDTERKHAVPESILDHLAAAHNHAESDEALYHIREAIQISESEIRVPVDADQKSLE